MCVLDEGTDCKELQLLLNQGNVFVFLWPYFEKKKRIFFMFESAAFQSSWDLWFLEFSSDFEFSLNHLSLTVVFEGNITLYVFFFFFLSFFFNHFMVWILFADCALTKSFSLSLSFLADNISNRFCGCWQGWPEVDGLSGWCQIHWISVSQ